MTIKGDIKIVKHLIIPCLAFVKICIICLKKPKSDTSCTMLFQWPRNITGIGYEVNGLRGRILCFLAYLIKIVMRNLWNKEASQVPSTYPVNISHSIEKRKKCQITLKCRTCWPIFRSFSFLKYGLVSDS